MKLLVIFGILLLGLTTAGMVTRLLLSYRVNSRICSVEVPFLTLRNIVAEECVFECKVRKRCAAVNYWTVLRVCDMLNTDAGVAIWQSEQIKPCIFITKLDIKEQSQAYDVCQACDDNSVCDLTTSSCIIKAAVKSIAAAPKNYEGGISTVSSVSETQECRKLQTANATVHGNVLSVGSKVKVTCDGWNEANPPPSVCQSNGTWSYVPSCAPVCSDPPTIANATVSSGDTLQGAVRDYMCEPGYGLMENVSVSVTCQDNGTWTPAEFQCVRSCLEPASVANATVLAGDTLQGAVRNYMCDPGYSLLENVSMSVTCQENGTWTPAEFKCVILCSDPPTVANATVSPGNTLQGAVRNYTCIPGYSFTNASTTAVTCQENGTWTTVQFECVLTTELPCPSSWIQLETGCYYTPGPSYTTDAHTAREYCHGLQAHLVEMETEAENTLIKDYLDTTSAVKQVAVAPKNFERAISTVSSVSETQDGGSHWWIGLTDEVTEGTFVWKETGNPPTYTDWRNNNEPSGGTLENYVVIWNCRGWADFRWDMICVPLCEKG